MKVRGLYIVPSSIDEVLPIWEQLPAAAFGQSVHMKAFRVYIKKPRFCVMLCYAYWLMAFVLTGIYEARPLLYSRRV
jgi:hypothetical protein